MKMKYYKLKYENGETEIIRTTNLTKLLIDRDLIDVDVRVFELEGEQLAIAIYDANNF